MKRKLILACLVALLAAATLAYARLADYTLPWSTGDSGGGDSRGGDYILSGTIGQPDAGYLSGGDYRLSGGFWGGTTASGSAAQRVYLPVVKKP